MTIILFGLQIWQHYFYGVHVDVFNDHKILQYVFTKTELNLTQMRWFKLLKDYDMSTLYHRGKSNVVVDNLNRLSMVSIIHLEEDKKELARDVHRLSHLGSPNYGFHKRSYRSEKWG